MVIAESVASSSTAVLATRCHKLQYLCQCWLQGEMRGLFMSWQFETLQWISMNNALLTYFIGHCFLFVFTVI